MKYISYLYAEKLERSNNLKYRAMEEIKKIQIRCTKCNSLTTVIRDYPEKAISMESDKCPECTELLGHYKGQTWQEWYVDKDGNKFNSKRNKDEKRNKTTRKHRHTNWL